MKVFFTAIVCCFFMVSVNAQNLNDKWQAEINKGKTEYAVDNYITAIEYFAKAANLIPTDSIAYDYLMDCAFKTKDLVLADSIFPKIKLIKEVKAEHYETLISLQREKGNNTRKLTGLIKTAKRLFPDDQGVATQEILSYYGLKHYRRAKNKIISYLKKHDATEQIYGMLIWIYLKQEKNLEKAENTIEEVLIAYPENYNFRKQKADLFIRKKKMEEAKPLLEQLIQEKPEDALNHYNLSLIEFEKKNYEKSAEICKRAIEADSSFVEAYYNVGTFYLFNGINYNLALNEMTVHQYEEQGEEFEFEAKRNLDMALPYLEKARELNQDDLDAFENLNTATEMLTTLNNNLREKGRAKMISDEQADNKDMASNVQILIDSTGTEMCASGLNDCGLPAIRINSLEVKYPEQQNILPKGQQAMLHFAVQNISNLDAYDLDIVLMQTVTVPGLKHNTTIKIDTLKSMMSQDFQVPIDFDTKDLDVPAIKNFDDVENKMRMFVKEKKGLSSSLVEFNVNLGYNLKVKTASETENLENFVPDDEARNFLLVVGINDYEHWTPLDNAVLDAKAVRDVLVSRYKFEKENVFEIYNKDANLRNIRNTLIKIKREITEADNLMIYYAGHGIYNEELESGSWVPVDAHTEVEKEYFKNEQLLGYLSKLKTKHIFVVADACFSGSLFVKGNTISFQENNDKLSSRWGLSSGNLEEVADGLTGANSPFAQELIKTLTEFNRESLPVSELINVVKFKVKNFNAQTPVGKPLAVEGNEGGEFILYRRDSNR